MSDTERDYSMSGFEIQQAMVDHLRKHPDKKTRPKTILWNHRHIRTSDSILVPREGIVRVEFVSYTTSVRQGIDLMLDDGWIQLADGQQITHLRTWADERFENVVEYPFFSGDGLLWTWNVYEMTYPGGLRVEEKWTGNAGFWIEIGRAHV